MSQHLGPEHCYLYVSASRSWHGWRSHRSSGATHSSTSSSLLLQHCPVEGVVILMVEGTEQDPEELSEIHVVWGLLKPQPAAVVEVHGKLCRESLAQNFNGCGHLLFTDLLVFLFLSCSLQSLPWQATSVEVHEDVPQALHVVPPALLNAQVCIDGGVSGSAGQVLVLSVWDVLPSSVVPVLLR